jgi:hypothetical protein
VQGPGPGNALGRVKFMFPNGHAIYLHDTPSRHLFGRGERAYSHGCIRVHEPLTLAQHVLNKPAWGEAEINRVVRRGSTRYVHLDEHLPVLLYYLTAKADAEGRVGFRRDIYNRDRRLFAALDQPVATGAERIAFVEPEPVEAAPAEVAEGEAVAAAEVAADAAEGEADRDAATGGEPLAAAPGDGAEAAAASGSADSPTAPTSTADAPPPAAAEPAPASAAALADTAGAALEEPAAAEAPADAGAVPEARPSDAEASLTPATNARLAASGAPGPTLHLDAEGRFADRPAAHAAGGSAGGSGSAEDAGSIAMRPEATRLDLSVTPPRIPAPVAGTGSTAGGGYPPVIRAPQVADEPPLWILPRDE